jgi:hypothetical protein
MKCWMILVLVLKRWQWYLLSYVLKMHWNLTNSHSKVALRCQFCQNLHHGESMGGNARSACTSLSGVLTRDIFSSMYHVNIHHMLHQHSPTMRISAASSEISLPHKKHCRYNTSATTQPTDTSMTTTFPAQLPQIFVFFGEQIPPPPCQFCYIFCHGTMCRKIDLFPIGKSFNGMHPIPWFQCHSTSISSRSIGSGHSKALALHHWGASSHAVCWNISAMSLRKQLMSAVASPILHWR